MSTPLDVTYTHHSANLGTIVWSTGESKKPRKAWTDALATVILITLETALNNIQSVNQPNAKSLDGNKLKVFEDDKLDIAKFVIFICAGRKHCGKGRKCRLPAFTSFATMITKLFCFRSFKLRIIKERFTLYLNPCSSGTRFPD